VIGAGRSPTRHGLYDLDLVAVLFDQMADVDDALVAGVRVIRIAIRPSKASGEANTESSHSASANSSPPQRASQSSSLTLRRIFWAGVSSTTSLDLCSAVDSR
jgi:hypothetical protein